MFRLTMESFMNMGISTRHFGQTRFLSDEGGIESSTPQAGHFKCIIALMKPLLVVLLMAASVHAQTVAEIARKERERQAKVKPAHVITSTESKIEEAKTQAAPEEAKAADAKAAPPAQPSKDATKPAAAPLVDPVEVWNKQTNELRTRIRTLQDQQMALQLQLNQANNQVYAPVTDPAMQERALALVGQIQQAIAAAQKQLDDAKRTLDAMLLQGPPKK